MKLLLIRHGQSSNNVLTAAGKPFEGRQADPFLTDLGKTQSKRLATAFAHDLLPRPDVLLCSPMQRAVQTAAPVADVLDLPIMINTLAYEVGGMFEGMPKEPGAAPGATASKLTSLSARVDLSDATNPPVTEDGWYTRGAVVETPTEAQERGEQLFEQLDSRYDNDTLVALVCHEWIIQYLIRSSMWVSRADGAPDPWFVIFNTATTFLATSRPGPRPFEGTGTRIISWVNRHDHLSAEEITH